MQCSNSTQGSGTAAACSAVFTLKIHGLKPAEPFSLAVSIS